MSWDYKKIGDVMSVERGGSPRPIKKYLTDSEDGLNWIKISDATASDKYIYETKQKITIDGLHKTRLVNEGDFLLSNSMSFGRPYIMKTKGCIHDGWLVLKEKEANVLNNDFLYHLLGSPYIFEQFDELASGSTVRNLNIGLVSSVSIPIPPLAEQQQIVEILDKAFTAIDTAKANIKKNIENAKELFQSKLNQVFSQTGEGWEEKTLGEVCEKTKNIKWQDYINEEFEYVDLSSLSRETLNITETTTINKENAPSRARKIILENDVIFATTRPTLKRATIIKSKLNGHLCSTGYVVLRPKENISSNWIFFYLLTSTFMDRMEKLQRGASYPAVSDNDVKNSNLSIPLSREIEKNAINLMKELRTNTSDLNSQYKTKLLELEELKKSILQKAFAGELTSANDITI